MGAPVPTSTGTLGHEAVKLKGKLVGKKRARDTEERNDTAEQSEEEESRAGAIKKKPRVDPFNPSGSKGKKKAEKQEVLSVEASHLPHTPLRPGTGTSDVMDQVADVASPGKALPTDGSPSVSPSKKRKKRHKKSAEEHATTASPLQPSANLTPRLEKSHTPPPVGPNNRSEVQGKYHLPSCVFHVVDIGAPLLTCAS